MPLSDIAIRDAQPTDRPQKLADGGGLYLLLNPNGSRWWRLRYRIAGKEKMLSLGTYPETGLEDAREKRDEARKLLAAGVDPGEQRKAVKAAAAAGAKKGPESMTREQVMNEVPTRARPLEALGIPDIEERAYCVLLNHHMATVGEVASWLSLPTRKTQQLLDSIESKGLVTHSPERPPRYIAAPPEFAVEALISQRQAVLERVRLGIPDLKRRAASTAENHEREQIVEIITSRAAVGRIYVQMVQTIQNEVLVFQRAPALFASHQEKPSGVRVRTISDEEYLALPGAMNLLRLDVESGEEARVFPTLPIKMVILDRRVGFIPLNPMDEDSPMLLVRSSALLDAFYSLFERTWERSAPIVFTRTGELNTGQPGPRLSKAAEQLIPLLAAGLNDKTIAHEAGMSRATLNRRIAELMKCFGTRTRFQLGLRAAAMDTLSER
jgi:sugar-specific transcriptional regulator TrmB